MHATSAHPTVASMAQAFAPWLEAHPAAGLRPLRQPCTCAQAQRAGDALWQPDLRALRMRSSRCIAMRKFSLQSSLSAGAAATSRAFSAPSGMSAMMQLQEDLYLPVPWLAVQTRQC